MTAADFSRPAPRLSVVNLEKANERYTALAKYYVFMTAMPLPSKTKN
jgi:hypothetical protein